MVEVAKIIPSPSKNGTEEMTDTWQLGDRVQVSLPYGTDGKTVHQASITSIVRTSPADEAQHTIRVTFDDPMIYGGLGAAWVRPEVITRPGETPAEPDREPPS